MQGREQKIFPPPPNSKVFNSHIPLKSYGTKLSHWDISLTLVSSMVELVGPHTHCTDHQLWWHSCLHEGKPIGPLTFHCILRPQLIHHIQSLLFHHISRLSLPSHISVLSCVKMSDLALPVSSHTMIWANQFMLCPFSFSVSTNALKFCSSYFLVFLNISSSINIQTPLFYHISKLEVIYLHSSVTSHSLLIKY
jgi:hypothetical protein